MLPWPSTSWSRLIGFNFSVCAAYASVDCVKRWRCRGPSHPLKDSQVCYTRLLRKDPCLLYTPCIESTPAAGPTLVLGAFVLPRRYTSETRSVSGQVESVATTLTLAEQNHAEELKRVCLDFASRNLQAVMLSEGYQHMIGSCPQLQVGQRWMSDPVACTTSYNSSVGTSQELH